MKPIFVFPGSFCPPTYGHYEIVKMAVKVFPELTIMCSVNKDKSEQWFTPEECAELWQAYDLPEGVEVKTLAEMKNVDFRELVMIRGLRNNDDLEYEKRVIIYNKEKFGIDKYFYLYTCERFKNTSSSLARKAAEELDLETLTKIVAPMVVTKMLEKVLEIKNLYLTVGPPASGKSTILKMLCELNEDFVHINTDDFNHQLKSYLQKQFPGKDLIQVACMIRKD